MPNSRGIRSLLLLGAHGDKGPAAEMCKLLRIGKVSLEAIGHALQEPIAGMPPERVIDDAQVFYVEHCHGQSRHTRGAALEETIQALAEQPTLGESGQRLEVR